MTITTTQRVRALRSLQEFYEENRRNWLTFNNKMLFVNAPFTFAGDLIGVRVAAVLRQLCAMGRAGDHSVITTAAAKRDNVTDV